MRRLVFLVYALVFSTELLQAAIVPLLPTFSAELLLSEVEAGAVLAAATFAMVVVSIPAGLLADRLGPRRLAVGSGGLVALSALGQGLAVDFWTLLGARMAYGVALGTVWTAGLALISSSTSRRRSAALGGSVTVGGLSHLVGPASAGYLSESFGLVTPFLAFGSAALVVTFLLALSKAKPRAASVNQRLLDALRAARGEYQVQSALALMGLLGLVVGVVHLLVPLQLHANGLSAGEIGVLFTSGSVVWITASALVARLGERAVSTRVAGVGALILAGVILLPFASAATAGLAAFLLLRGAAGAPLSTITYPLAEVGARAARMGGGTVLGLMNVSWGAAAFVGPVVAGALAGAVSARWTWGLLVGCCLAVGAFILGTRRGRPAPARVAVPAPHFESLPEAPGP